MLKSRVFAKILGFCYIQKLKIHQPLLVQFRQSSRGKSRSESNSNFPRDVWFNSSKSGFWFSRLWSSPHMVVRDYDRNKSGYGFSIISTVSDFKTSKIEFSMQNHLVCCFCQLSTTLKGTLMFFLFKNMFCLGQNMTR